jgi:hypothetical protein
MAVDSSGNAIIVFRRLLERARSDRESRGFGGREHGVMFIVLILYCGRSAECHHLWSTSANANPNSDRNINLNADFNSHVNADSYCNATNANGNGYGNRNANGTAANGWDHHQHPADTAGRHARHGWPDHQRDLALFHHCRPGRHSR